MHSCNWILCVMFRFCSSLDHFWTVTIYPGLGDKGACVCVCMRVCDGREKGVGSGHKLYFSVPWCPSASAENATWL